VIVGIPHFFSSLIWTEWKKMVAGHVAQNQAESARNPQTVTLHKPDIT
jgi:hypothetical protein